MKNILIISSFLLASTLASSVHAARTPTKQTALEGTTFVGMAITGAVAAGPIGFVIGALGGAFLADQTRQANNAELTLDNQQRQTRLLQTHIDTQSARIQHLEALAASQMTFQILFGTGSDSLTELDQQRILILAQHLEENPSLVIQLDGHSDPRGTDEYNNVLSQERAKSVKDALVQAGIDERRIRYQGHGNRFSTATKGDEKAYQLERRVDISVEMPIAVYTDI